MQTKRYASDREATIGAGGVRTMEIVNESTRRANWHGIRFSGRIRADNASADNEANGWIAIVCQPGEYTNLIESSFDNDSDLENLSEVIVAVLPWSVFGGSTHPVEFGAIFDFDIVINTSRTCGKGTKLIGYIVSNSVSAKNVLHTSQLSAFETVI